MKRIGSTLLSGPALVLLIGLGVYFFMPDKAFGTDWSSFCEAVISKRATLAFSVVILTIAIVAFGFYPSLEAQSSQTRATRGFASVLAFHLIG